MRDLLPDPPATTGELPSEPLSHSLKQRHLTMLGLGGVIGAGLFVGSGAGIGIAAPRSSARTCSRASSRCS